jgi:2',3'-cyclic-nucleotide 2'-phosphodiesterase (5'-nucleotidase family)
MDAPIATAATALEHRRPEGTLGNWVADVLQAKAVACTGNADFALCNYGGLRIPRLPQGTWTLGLIYELMPFDNVLITVAVPGTAVQQLLDAVAADGGWPASKELQFTIREGKATAIKIKGKPLDPSATYQVVLSDYLANGGSNLEFLKPFPKKDCQGVLLRDVLIEGAKRAQGPIQVAIEGRITR